MGRLFYAVSSGKVSLRLDGVLRSIANPEIYDRLFAAPMDPAGMTRYSGASPYLEGRPLSDNAKLIKASNHPEVYLVDDLGNGLVRRSCASAEVFEALGFGWDKIESMTRAKLSRISVGPSLSLDGYGSLGFTGNQALRIGKTIPLSDDWTIETFFMYPLEPALGWKTLARGSDRQHHVIVSKSNRSEQLGIYCNDGGGFFRCGYDLRGLSSGWHHLAAVGQGNRTIFYIDGLEVGSVNKKTKGNILSIGNYQGGGQPFGRLAEIRVWSAALSAFEVMANSRKPALSGSEPNLLANYPLTEGQGASIADRKGCRNGTAFDSPAWEVYPYRPWARGWMESIWDQIKNKPLLEVCFPGSHDSGTYQLSPRLAPDANDTVTTLWETGHQGGAAGIDKYVTAMAVAQSLTLYHQLQRGIRYVDLRLCSIDGKFYACRSLQGNLAEILLRDIRRFLDDNPMEVVLLKVGFKQLDDRLTAAAWKLMQAELGEYFNAVSDTLNLGALSLAQVVESRKRCLILLDETLVSSIYDPDKTSNTDVVELLQRKTLDAPRYRTTAWFQIAEEGQTFSLPRATVRYGRGDKWITKTVSGQAECGVAFFGEDPAPGETKVCEVQVDGDFVIEKQMTWLSIADEGDDFLVQGRQRVRFGRGDKWIEKEVEGPGSCGVAFFGSDPAENDRKVVQLLVRDGRLLEAQCCRPISHLNFVLAYLQTYGFRLLPVLPILAEAPVIGPLLSAAGVATIPSFVTYLENFDPMPASLLENARDSRSILRDYINWLEGPTHPTRPQLLVCDFVEELPLVEIAIRLNTGRSCQDLLSGVEDAPGDRLSDPLSMLGCDADAVATAFQGTASLKFNPA